MFLIVVAEECIKAMFLRHPCSTGLTETPLAEATGCVAGVFEVVGYGHIICAQTAGSPDGGMPGMLAGHECASRGSADTGTRQKLSEAHSFGG